ncbi:MAG: alpha-amylase family glycosyl hydrolase, partial [Saprospiraceae bacterium]|nr:alpha-amylase family glycosyl hydrolase [Saprospiraceae bacterium]
YELLVRDFIGRHDYTTLIDTLAYLDRLGVNAIELMPVSEFEGNISWGYNPSFHLALDKYYGPKNEFKRFVDSCHGRGIAVILDVVYNHAFSQSPLAQLYWDASAFRPTPENPWLNPVARHPFNVGYDFNHESDATRIFVDRVLEYWTSEFRVDGYRFDLSKGFTQRQSDDDSEFRLFDSSRVSILKHYADVVWGINPDAYIILEHFAENREEIELSDYGMLLWAGAGVHNQYLEAAMGYNSDLSGAFASSRGWNRQHLVAYMESHDEERMMYKNLEFGNGSGSYNVKSVQTALDRIELASAFFYTVPGPKMLWQFGELGYDFSINHCQDGSVNPACRTDPKPIVWNYFQQSGRRDAYEKISAMIRLKKNFEVFSTDDFSMSVQGTGPKKIQLNHPTMDAAVVGNFDVVSRSLSRPFQHPGTWYEFFSGDSIVVSSVNTSMTLLPGEYRIYTSENIGTADDIATSATEQQEDPFRLRVFPNPSSGEINVRYRLERASMVSLQMFDQEGRQLQTLLRERQGSGEHTFQHSPALPAGTYYLVLVADGRIEVIPLIVE